MGGGGAGVIEAVSAHSDADTVYNDGAESFGMLKLNHNVTKEFHESSVIFWYVGGGWEVVPLPSA